MPYDPKDPQRPQTGSDNVLETALQRLAQAASVIEIDDDILARLRQPQELLQARLNITMDDGSRSSFKAWRCRYEDARGPTKGGIRFHHDASAEEVQALAFWMTVKCAVANLPFGGGKGAVRVDARKLSDAEKERLSRAYVRAFAPIMGPERDIPAPDIATNARVMGWMLDEYQSATNRHSPAFITGKPIALGGSLGREDATARGGFILLRHLEERLGIGNGQRRAAIQGFGNAGQHIATLLQSDGWKIVAVSDSGGAIENENGLDIDALLQLKQKGWSVHTLAGKDGVKNLSEDDFFAIDCELLVPAALEDQITLHNAASIRAKTILELANGPVMPEADAILEEKGVRVLPDILANAGGVIVSYFEWEQNRQGTSWALDDVHGRLATIIREQGDLVWKTAEEKEISLRSAAYTVGLKRIIEAIRALS